MTRPTTPLRLTVLATAMVLVFMLFYLGAQPFAARLTPPPWDKLAHFLTYATLTCLLRLGIGGNHPWLLVALVGIIGCADEWHQLSLPGRSADLTDLATDVAAAFVAIMACEWYEKCRRPSPPDAGHSG